MSKGLKRFFIICAVFIVLGVILSIAGYAMGGVHNMYKVDEKYDWFSGGETKMLYTNLPEGTTFEAVNVSGNTDVLVRAGQTDQTRIGYRATSAAPAFTVNNGVLSVTASQADSGVINFSYGDRRPVLEVYVPEGSGLRGINADISGDIMIENVSVGTVTINDDNGDISFMGTMSETIDVTAGYGDINGANMKCPALYVKTENGDVELQGSFTGKTNVGSEFGDVDIEGEIAGRTDIRTESGDISVETTLAETMYTMSVTADAGEIEIGEREYDTYGNAFNSGTGQNILNILAEYGDIEIGFGQTFM